jgi:hypothetical protein
MINLVFLYYDNPHMLRVQIDCWNSYADALKSPPRVLLIDDGSPKTRAADIVRKIKCRVPIQVFRIQEDIPWNFAGARNLGCHHARGWIYVSDIDTLLYAEDAKKLFEGPPLQREAFYMPKRVWLPSEVEARPGIVNLLFHKSKYREIGGYDEDYAGHYGREETDYHNRLKRAAHKIYREDVIIRVVSPKLVRDAHTHGRVRDKTRNIALYEQKEAAGYPRPANPLRFAWERVI